MSSKTCSKCKIEKTLSSFKLNKAGNYSAWCYECDNILAKNRYASDPEYRAAQLAKNKIRYFQEGGKQRKRERQLKKSFGLTIDDYNKKLQTQDGLCAICKKPESSLNAHSSGILPLAIDHDHQTGKVRDLLCSRCNQALGLLREDVEIAKNLVTYIQKHIAPS